jgi:hypothetical protein
LPRRENRRTPINEQGWPALLNFGYPFLPQQSL